MGIGETMFAVVPKTDCEHLTTLSPQPLPSNITSHRSIFLYFSLIMGNGCILYISGARNAMRRESLGSVFGATM